MTAGARLRYMIRLLIAFAFLFWSGSQAYFGVDSIAWPQVEASLIDQTANNTGAIDSLVYSYQVHGVSYYASRIRFGDCQFSNSAKELNSYLNSGKQLCAFYNPDNPSMACLLTGFHKLGVYIPLGIGCFLLIVAGIEHRSRYLIR